MEPVVIRPSLKFIKAGYFGILSIVIAAAAVAIWQQLPWLPAVAALLFLSPLQHHLRRQTTKLTAFEDKIRYESGLLSKTTRTIPLAKIQDVTVSQGPSQRLFRVGDVSIETAGETSRLTMKNIDGPQAVADQILQASRRSNL